LPSFAARIRTVRDNTHRGSAKANFFTLRLRKLFLFFILTSDFKQSSMADHSLNMVAKCEKKIQIANLHLSRPI